MKLRDVALGATAAAFLAVPPAFSQDAGASVMSTAPATNATSPTQSVEPANDEPVTETEDPISGGAQQAQTDPGSETGDNGQTSVKIPAE